VSQDERYENYGIDLQVDDLLLLYTDGAIEATNFAGEFYGRERLMKALQTNGKLELGTALRAIQWDVRRFVGLAEQTDDLTLLGLRVVA
jgi:sigma-B regulation protein RsbU (phosphoserine phosphatase)